MSLIELWVPLKIDASDRVMEYFEKKILMVDDDIEDREIFAQIIHQIDPSIVCLQPASTPLALDLLVHDKFIPHYIFLDLNMPIMNGFEFLKELKQHTHLSMIQVIVYTTSAQEEDWKKARLLGANGLLTKDSSIKNLRAALMQLLHFDRAVEIDGSEQFGNF